MRHLKIEVKSPELRLYPINDVQLGAAGCDVDAFARYVEESARDEEGMFFGAGDYTDGISPSNRRTLAVAYENGGIYDTLQEMIDDAAHKQTQDFIDIMGPAAGRVPFWLKGHHLYRYKERQFDGTYLVRTTDHDIARALGGVYLGDSEERMSQVLVSFVFPKVKRNRPNPVLTMYAMHGQSSGGHGHTYTTPLSVLQRMTATFNADIYFTAHYHKVVAARHVKLHQDPNAKTRLDATDSLLVSGGSWMKSYMPDEVTYAEDGVMSPLAIGTVTMDIKVREDGTFSLRSYV